ncbi:lecithin retinol acyltransferase family protein [Cupriavidus consociatus]|uniref:lecithin retinol acyltransferase family protein n=1 Tax=Cupriavidus consociatus TaxID=2821357 RepID=UPI001FD79E62|nr:MULTISPECIES: lecithin retinol acyltransferase family protein [unclassified Cupriavidus]MDK2658684.1 lecithin retinol acyltransferase family protein [Cupriavidus sp. LEh21]
MRLCNTTGMATARFACYLPAEASLSSPLPFAADVEPPLGAHLVTPRHGYAHHGIYVGDGKVVHYAGYCHRQQRGPVEELSLDAFAAGHGITVLAAPMARYGVAESVRRARSRLGEDRYRLLTNNCEHFCTWCLYGESRSEQVRHCMMHPLSGLRLLASLLACWWKTAARQAWDGVPA